MLLHFVQLLSMISLRPTQTLLILSTVSVKSHCLVFVILNHFPQWIVTKVYFCLISLTGFSLGNLVWKPACVFVRIYIYIKFHIFMHHYYKYSLKTVLEFVVPLWWFSLYYCLLFKLYPLTTLTFITQFVLLCPRYQRVQCLTPCVIKLAKSAI